MQRCRCWVQRCCELIVACCLVCHLVQLAAHTRDEDCEFLIQRMDLRALHDRIPRKAIIKLPWGLDDVLHPLGFEDDDCDFVFKRMHGRHMTDSTKTKT